MTAISESEGRTTWTWSSFGVCLLAAAAVVLDGFDNQLLSHLLPSLSREWQHSRADFAPVLSAGLFGMSIGTIAAGRLGDRFGRKTMLIISILVFGVFTLICAGAANIWQLAALRLAAGIGLGGAMPNATVLISEFAPPRYRPIAVTLGIVCIPLGGVISGLLSSYLLGMHDWTVLFVIGGVAPIVLGVLLVFGLRESPDFVKGAREAGSSDGTHRASHRAGRASLLFSPAYLRDTVGLWLAFAACLAGVYICFNWLPSILTLMQFTQAEASQGLASYNFGGMIGAIVVGVLIMKFGSRVSVTAFAIGACLTAMALREICDDPAWANRIVLVLSLEGALMNGVQVAMFAIAAQVYPISLRATGVGLALGVGRLAAVVSPFVTAGFMTDASHASSNFVLIAALMAICAGALILMVRHIPPARSIPV